MERSGTLYHGVFDGGLVHGRDNHRIHDGVVLGDEESDLDASLRVLMSHT